MSAVLSNAFSAAIVGGLVMGSCSLQEAKAKEINCLAMNIYHESRSEPLEGQFAVAHVTMNRVESKRYPDHVCSVVYQRKQFSWTHMIKDHTPNDEKAWETALNIANVVYKGDQPDNTGDAMYYHADYVEPYWADEDKRTVKIGRHIFYAG